MKQQSPGNHIVSIRLVILSPTEHTNHYTTDAVS